jgi:hypothetical protein
MAWFIVVGLFALIYVALAFRFRPSTALGIVVPLVWCFTTWMRLDVPSESLDIRHAVAILLLALYPFLPRAGFPWRLVPSDYAVAGLFLLNWAVDWYHDGIFWATPAVAYVEWIVPYLAGRLAFQESGIVEKIQPLLAGIAVFFAVTAIYEAFSGSNPFEVVFGARPIDGIIRDSERWGIKRAFGTSMHPLYHGVLICWSAAWLFATAYAAAAGRASKVWLVALPIMISAPLATGSRGPFLALFAAGIGFVFCRFTKTRLTIAVGLVLIVAGFFVFQETVLSSLDDWSGEYQRDPTQAKTVVFDGQAEKFSSARSRLTLLKIYWKPLRLAGLLGYGSEAVDRFPVNVPLDSDAGEAARDIWALDNHYLLVWLRFGFPGLILFGALIGISLWQTVRVVEFGSRFETVIFACWLFGATFAVGCLMFLVWMPVDYGFPWLWGIGASAGMYHRKRYSTAVIGKGSGWKSF